MKHFITENQILKLLLCWCCMLLVHHASAQTLVNPNANVQAKTLKLFIENNYGKKIISGQDFENVGENWLSVISSASGGKQPAMIGLDFMNSTTDRIAHGSDPDAMTNKAIDWVNNKGGIVTFHWHWDAPKNVTGVWYQAFYTANTSFDISYAVNNTSSQDYQLLVRDMDMIAAQLKKLQDAGIAVIWRPLHEAEGGWFWWGAKDGESCKKLYRAMYDRFTNYHKLNNLIWAWTSYGGGNKGNWYPGDDVVDMVVYDYDGGSAWSSFTNLFGGKGKQFALGEEGRLPDPNNFSSRPWSYFLTWAYMITDQSKNTSDWINKVYNDSRTITLSDLPKWGGLVANAGADQSISITTGTSASVTLDGSGSSDSKGIISSYVWKENGVQIATGVKPTVTLALGSHTITLTVTDSNNSTSTDDVVVAVKLPNIALAKPVTVSSTEAGANVAANAVDGNATTRWSSLYADPQWIQIDLQGNYKISAVTLNWEAASAKDYKIEVSPDASAWTTVVTKTGMATGARIDNLSGLTATGRYVRMTGTARTSTFGYSLFEFEVNGTIDNGQVGPKANAGADQSVTDADNSGAEQITLDGSLSSDATATITSYAWKENGTQIATGVKPTVSLAVGTHTISLTVTNSNNLVATDDVVVTVNPFVQVNIALNKPVTVSSTESGSTNVGGNAVDGNTTTRWSSVYADPQWIQVDLQASYTINKVVLNWEAASGKDYKVETSSDGTTWTTLVSKTAMPAGPRVDNLTGLSATGRYIRMTGTARNTQWGYSLFEFEVYGATANTVAVTGVTLTPGTVSLNAGQTQQLTATVAPANATNKSVSFVSSNTAVATVSASGLVTAVANGTATITVTTADGSKTATSVITVSTTTVAVTGVTLTPTSISLSAAGQTQQLSAVVAPSDASNKNVSYASSNTSVATVSASGIVTAVANGTSTITVTTQDGGKTATSAVTVNISACTLLSRYGVPRASALPSLNTTFPNIFVLGTGGPNLSNVSSGVVQWDLQNNGLWQFAFNTTNGSPDWYVNLVSKTTQNFSSASPACKITGSGITNLDGDYWANMDGANFVIVAKSGNYAIYFSTTSTQPSSCNGRMVSAEESNEEVTNMILYPTEVAVNSVLHVTLPGHMSGGNFAIVDINGRRVKRDVVNGKQIEIMIDHTFNRGMYLLNVSKNSQVYIKKFVVK